MRKLIWLPIAIILAFVAGRLIYYGFGSYTPPARALHKTEIEAAARSARVEAVDNPTVSKGVVAIDYAHTNALFVEELNVLLTKIVSRGFSYELITGGAAAAPDDAAVAEKSAPKKDDSAQSLANKLRYAQTLILPLPQKEYTPDEITEIKRFVEKGGRVMLLGDPTRTVIVEALNSIAGAFGIIYANDYLYSMEHNDNNYRNVVYSNFKESPITAGLDKDHKVIFYGGGSINAPGHEIILGDDTTFSSTSEGGRTMAAAALTTNDQVLALGDLTFLGEPYSAAEGNGTLINNIADFLTGGRRSFELKDFPYFFNPAINVVFHNTMVFNSQFPDSVKLKDMLENLDHKVTFSDKIDEAGSSDVIFVGRFKDAEVVKPYLDRGGITIVPPDEQNTGAAAAPAEAETTDDQAAENGEETPDKEARFIKGRIRVADVGDLEQGGSTLFYLDQQDGRNVLIILSENPDTNADAFKLLMGNKLDDCRVSSTIAVCQTQEPDGGLPPSQRSKRIDKVLVVSSDTGRPRMDEQTGAVDFSAVLSTTYSVDTWVISQDGSPDVDQLLEYDAIIWTTGDYWDDSISEEDAALLTRYIELGGNLILSGASIGFDWDHSDFLTKVAHADYTGFAEQKDLEVAMPDHPIARGFAEGGVITLTVSTAKDSKEKLQVDVVHSLPDARVIFKRGPESEEPGAASVIAFEDKRSKVAYFAFPIYQLPAEARDLLINNTIDWFTRKPLDLPDTAGQEPAKRDNKPTPTPTPEGDQDNTGDTGNGNGDQGDNQDNGNDNSNGDDTNGTDNQDQTQ